MPLRIRATVTAASAATVLAMSGVPVHAQAHSSVEAVVASSSTAAASVPGGRVRVVLKGNRLGKKARVVVRGVKGKAKGWKTTVRVKKAKTVKKVTKKKRTARPLPPGRYVVIGKRISAGASEATANRKRVKVKKNSGARAVLRYTTVPPVSSDQPDPVDPSLPAPTPTAPIPDPPADTTPPGPVTGLTTGKITGTTIKLEWTLPGDADLSEILLRRAPGTTAPPSVNDGQSVDLPFPVAAFTTDVGLDPGSDYAYSVFARDAEGNTSGPASISTSTASRDILAEAVLRSPSGTEVPTARVVDEDDSGTINADDVVLLGEVSTAFDASSTAKLGPRSLTVNRGVVQSTEECSLTHSGDPANVMTFSTANNAETWRDKGASDTTELVDSLTPALQDVIAISPTSPTAPGLVLDRNRSADTDDAFLDVATFCSGEGS